MGLELAKLWVRLRADDQGMQADLSKTKGKLASFGREVSDFFMSKLGIRLNVAGALDAGLKSITLASAFEQDRVAFETMLGSIGAAQKAMEDLTNFAASTPFEMRGLIDTSKVLLGYGVVQEDLISTMKMLGDVSSGTGKNLKELAVIFGQIKAKGRLQGGELMQLREAGIGTIGPLIAKQMGIAESALDDFVSKGKVGFDQVQKAFMTLTSEGGQFANLMEKQSQTLGGLWSTLVDGVIIALTDLGRMLAPLVKGIIKVAIVIVDAIGGAIKFIRDLWFEFLDLLGFDVAKAVDDVAKATTKLTKATEAAGSTGIEVKQEAGAFNFAELGRKIQDQLLQRENQNEMKMISLMESGNRIQSDILNAVSKEAAPPLAVLR